MKKGLKSGGDPRVRYTRNILRDSLIELMKTRPVTEIGVKEICALAAVSRSTFYTYYDDVYKLLEEVEEEVFGIFEDMANQFGSLVKKFTKRDSEEMYQRHLQYIADNSNVLQILLGEHGDIDFQKKFFQKFIAQTQKILQNNAENPEEVHIHEGYSVFLVVGSIGLMHYWLKNNMPIPIPELAKMFVKLTEGI